MFDVRLSQDADAAGIPGPDVQLHPAPHPAALGPTPTAGFHEHNPTSVTKMVPSAADQ
jgi:hypothetical protein